MKVGVVGTRTFNDYYRLEEELKKHNITELISGGCIGADKLAERYARSHKIPLKLFLPDWCKYGKSAGPIRNRQIVLNSNLIIAFWDGISKGTLSTIQLAKNLNTPLIIIKI